VARRLPPDWAAARVLSSLLRRARSAVLIGRTPAIDQRLIEMDWGASRAAAELRAGAGVDGGE
jgi:hypothetical protein